MGLEKFCFFPSLGQNIVCCYNNLGSIFLSVVNNQATRADVLQRSIALKLVEKNPVGDHENHEGFS